MARPGLHPRIREIIAELSAAQEETDALCAAITPAEETRRLGDGWSVAEVVEHMAIVEDGARRIVSGIAKQVVDVAETGDDPIAPTISRYRVADRHCAQGRSTGARAPHGGASVPVSAARMRESRARLIAALEAASGTALGGARFPHPLFGPLDGYQWALLAAQHQRRHLVQIRSILSF